MTEFLSGKEFEGKIGTVGDYSGDLNEEGKFKAEANVKLGSHGAVKLTVDADLAGVLKEYVLKLSFVQKVVAGIEKFTGVDIDGSDKAEALPVKPQAKA